MKNKFKANIILFYPVKNWPPSPFLQTLKCKARTTFFCLSSPINDRETWAADRFSILTKISQCKRNSDKRAKHLCKELHQRSLSNAKFCISIWCIRYISVKCQHRVNYFNITQFISIWIIYFWHTSIYW